MRQTMLSFDEIARVAGYKPGPDGKFNLPPTQETADKLANAASECVGEWHPGDERIVLTLTGAGPVWGYLAIAHALHGRVTTPKPMRGTTPFTPKHLPQPQKPLAKTQGTQDLQRGGDSW